MANLYRFIDTNEMPDMTIRLPDEGITRTCGGDPK